MKLKIFFQNHSKVFIFDLEFEFRDLILMEKIPHTPYLCLLLLLNFVVSVSVSVSAESIGQLQFRFRYRAETKMVVSVVHYLIPCFDKLKKVHNTSERPKPLFWFRSDTTTETLIG